MGFGAVEHHEAHPGLGRRLHAEHHGGLVGVPARAHVLDVEHQGVEAGERLRRRAQRGLGRAVQRVDGHAGARVALPAHRRHVLRVAPHAVLGAEQRGQLDPGRGVEEVGGVLEARGDRGGVADEPHPAPPQRAEAGRREDVQPGAGPSPRA